MPYYFTDRRQHAPRDMRCFFPPANFHELAPCCRPITTNVVTAMSICSAKDDIESIRLALQRASINSYNFCRVAYVQPLLRELINANWRNFGEV